MQTLTYGAVEVLPLVPIFMLSASMPSYAVFTFKTAPPVIVKSPSTDTPSSEAYTVIFPPVISISFCDLIASSGAPIIYWPSLLAAERFPELLWFLPPIPPLPLYLMPVFLVSTTIFPPVILTPPDASVVYFVPAVFSLPSSTVL